MCWAPAFAHAIKWSRLYFERLRVRRYTYASVHRKKNDVYLGFRLFSFCLFLVLLFGGKGRKRGKFSGRRQEKKERLVTALLGIIWIRSLWFSESRYCKKHRHRTYCSAFLSHTLFPWFSSPLFFLTLSADDQEIAADLCRLFLLPLSQLPIAPEERKSALNQ